MLAVLHLNLYGEWFVAIVAKTGHTECRRRSSFWKTTWLKFLPELTHAVKTIYAAEPIAPADFAAQFARAQRADVTEILKTLETFGRARKAGDGKFRA